MRAIDAHLDPRRHADPAQPAGRGAPAGRDAVDAVLGQGRPATSTVGSRSSASSATNSGLLTGLGVLELRNPGMDRSRSP